MKDVSRLKAAFRELEKGGILARQDFACCRSCGVSELHEEIEKKSKRKSISGYVFYHAQDTDSAKDDGKLYLAYGTLDEEGRVFIGKRVVDALKAHGFRPKWSGDENVRILIPVKF